MLIFILVKEYIIEVKYVPVKFLHEIPTYCTKFQEIFVKFIFCFNFQLFFNTTFIIYYRGVIFEYAYVMIKVLAVDINEV